MKNHLVIGLGGTGGKIIRSLRKNIFQEFRQRDPDTVNIRYLYVDSSKEMMALNDATWRTLGANVQLDPRSQLLITGGNLNQILNNLDNYPGIRPWIGSRDQWADILNSIVGETLGGQKRRLGRFLFSCKAREFKDQLRQLASEMTTGGESAVTFHVCVGLAGGTGSGSVIDIVSQIRNLYRDSRDFRIIIYALLPDEFPKPNWDTGNYHANGFAALLELNAMSVSAYRPHDVTGAGDRLQLSDPFNGCYAFTNQNANGLQLDVDKELPNTVADFLFQKIVALQNWPTISRMENAENGDGTPESRPGTNVGERSKRFLAFGIKRLTIPEAEIREYLTYKFARQAALQLRFNNWDDLFGFRDEPRNQDFGEFVKQRETQERWLISDDHICLSRGILPEETNNKKWKPINREWMDVIPEFVMMAQEKQDSTWLNELEKLCAQRFDETYRGLGVRKFYETKLAARRDHVREIRRRIESELFDEWKNGVKSMHDISRETDALLGAIEERVGTVDTRLTKAKENEELAEKKVQANRAVWAKVGPFSALLGRRKSLLDAQGECLRDLYIYRTLVEAWGFAKKLLQELTTEITRLGSDVHGCATLIDDAIKDFNEWIAERCNDGAAIDLRQSIVRFYRAEKVKEFAKELEKDKIEQTRQSQAVRMALIEQLGGDPGFAQFNARIPKQRFLDVLEQKCEASSQAAHNNLIATNRDRIPLFGVNIVGALEREYSGKDDDLKTFIHNLVQAAGSYLDFDPQEVNRSAPGVPSGTPTKISQFMVILPKAQEYAKFADNLKGIFRQQLRGDIPAEIIESDSKPHEITLVTLTNLFPLRYVKSLRFLKERYDQRLTQTDRPDRVKLELHGEGDGSQYPPLFVPDRDEVLDKALPYLMLAKIMGIIQPITNPVSGSTELYLIEADEDGLDKRTKLGKTRADLFESLDPLLAQRFEQSVCALLAKPDYQHQDKRAALMTQVRDELKAVLAERGGNVEDKVYLRFEQAARKAIQLLRAD